ncbi:DUF2268 domain-containing putative Zn-dependent protease [Anaerocolumna sp. MB42-C2]|uniref:DUF2268 domain-containing putative Zn-dependent protease n=1 Tax=Anaerocolumna sp. MB42-C2 TaxID=3070997 RepID=UPI0027E06213|nr:DUF2268 domain-containing putative Zn-dependent protease [Anaerocolumna sp. MB42-C2]WMJ87611.1 DUF2268 domain-containing putative Zn-dependent protease [Anaerocolumna sp. MB42-C2]
MVIKIINDFNYLEYRDLIMDTYNISVDTFNKLSNNGVIKNKHLLFSVNELEKTYKLYIDEFKGSDYNVWILTGNIAEMILKQNPIHGCTIFYKNKILCFITWKENFELLKRVMLHELCHAYRIKFNKIITDIEYIKYLNDPLNWLYEEILAISTEKKYFNSISWEEIIGFKYNSVLRYYDNKKVCSKIYKIYDIYDLLANNYNDLSSIIYYIAYYFSKNSFLLYQLNEMVHYDSKTGLSLMISFINAK